MMSPSPTLRRPRELMDTEAWERREEGGVGEVPQGTDHGLLRRGGTGAVYGRGGEHGALRANAAVAERELDSVDG